MCGICGEVTTQSRGVDEAALRRMTAALRHRGPDDQGIEVFGERRAGFGHTRLSIIDLSPAGRQPMANEDGTIWVTANGEIYNFPELRQELEAQGHRFRSRCDVEVIVHLYEAYGVACVERLWGMFAFALWDAPRQRLVLARDRLGKKPLYYAGGQGALVFASELAALTESPLVSAEVEPSAVHDYLTYGYVPAPGTIFCGVSKLPPAHRLVWERGAVRVERYWQVDAGTKRDASEAEWGERVMELLRDATRRRMVSDVPVGAFLSGGLDSSAVVALMSEASSRPVKTFSIGFDDASFNELPYARQVAEQLGTEHRELTVRPETTTLLPQLVERFGEPFADSSALATWELARLVRSDVTVALNGDGGDEVFAGYDRYRAAVAAQQLSWWPKPLVRVASRMAGYWPESGAKRDPVQRAKRFLKGLTQEPTQRYAGWISYFLNGSKEALYTPRFAERLAGHDSMAYMREAWRQAEAADLVDRLQGVDRTTYLPGDLLPKVDVTSMAHALEVRSPLLDHRLFELSAQMPVSLKVRGGVGKYLLRKLFAGRLPDAVLRRSKAGFGVPVGRWFRGPLSAWVRELLLSEQATRRGYFERSALERLLQEHAVGRVDHGQRIWALAVLELWHQRFVDREPSLVVGD